MKANIHPQYYDEAKVICACGNTAIIGGTAQEIRVDVCNNCHPFFTGEMKYLDTLGKVERFEKSRQKAKELAVTHQKKITEKAERIRPQSLREMIDLVKKQASS